MIQLLFNGLVTGLLVALPALALSLTFGVLRFANFAIGAMLTAGAYLIWAFNALAGWPLPAAVAAGAAGSALLALAADWLVFRPLRDRSGVTLLVASMGLAFVLENAVRLAAGGATRGYEVAASRPIRLAGLRINQEQVLTLAVTVAALAAVWLLLRHTRLGRAMRAVADNAPLAAVRGISQGRVVAATWAVAGVLTALAGLLVGLDIGVDPLMGWNYLLPVFAAAVLGGIGQPLAAVPGALLLGVAAELSTLWLPPHYRAVVAFALMALCLLLRPAGLFGSRWVTR
ncbi:High-affinity branched-chain amino acid transport system permease protein LivH [Achromobacter deleyi]|uniref:High-affinity branched-chain amino acid transport system permease protein LivH n=1 Tax=Achromobacter deleyi TaxID=1353891 RepID=A0A6S6Z6V9_9BURK|nr:branched-chain amino acid ABC transporter permease [Achromobacter deleyi]CAB3665024.1 High-affinity branched-chain amino acid transport system permease protein LivH [Achromobacter deleyi]CAB3822985.1 High-affinity branched-chain amino acid transport system permease protein LivH [Achromobacter deleyi]CAB3834609.1 High-affinity branched-chain amino acid transport system permease protein LivH [Achromobacter deleyi]